MTGSDRAVAPPSVNAHYNGQPSARLHDHLSAALAKLPGLTEGGAPPAVSGPANRACQDALKAVHDALTQVAISVVCHPD